MNIYFIFFLASLIFCLSQTIVITRTYVVRMSKEQAENLGKNLMYDGRGSQQVITCGKGKRFIIKIE